MVRDLLTRQGSRLAATVALLLLATPAFAAPVPADAAQPKPPDLLLQGGRRLAYEGSFSREREAKGKPGFWGKLVNVIAGEAPQRALIRPYSIAVDSRKRIIVTDPGAAGVHIFDFAKKKYKFIERQDTRKDQMLAPQCVTLDARDNIYVTDSESGRIFVFNADGKYQRVIGSLKGGEGYFKRPTGIAVDSAAQRIYITDTLRDKVFILDLQGVVLGSFGRRGVEPGQFNFPTELLLSRDGVAVVDAMNFRVQFLGRDGQFRNAIGQLGDSSGAMFRPKGISRDSEGNYYVVDGLWGVVQVFNPEGQLLYYFGKRGTAAGDFQLPAGIHIDRDDRIYVVDSHNRRVQIFRYQAAPTVAVQQ